MMKKRAVIVLVMGMIMVIGLTACQKSAGGAEENSGQAKETTEEAVNMAEVSGTEQEDAPQGEPSLAFPFADSPEFQACAKWQEFLDGYDTDGAILAKVENEPIAGYEYEEYLCYSKEMEDKIDELCEYYGLSKLSGCQLNEGYSDLLGKVGIGGFCTDSENAKHNILSGYLYSDGTFMIEGSVTLRTP